jgi:hypothetical protein
MAPNRIDPGVNSNHLFLICAAIDRANDGARVLVPWGRDLANRTSPSNATALAGVWKARTA